MTRGHSVTRDENSLFNLNPDWHRELWARVPDGRILHLASDGTRHLAYHNPGHRITTLPSADSPAIRHPSGQGQDLITADLHQLPFADSAFDHAVGGFLLRGIRQHPVEALAEVRRVLKMGGRLFTLEYGLSEAQLAR